MGVVGGGGVSSETLEDILDRQREKNRPPWYERAPWSWMIGFLFGIAGAGVVFWLGWN